MKQIDGSTNRQKEHLLREDLLAEFQRFRPETGDFIIVRYRDTLDSYSPQFAKWIGETIGAVLPEGARLIVLSAPGITSIDTIRPSDNLWRDKSYIEKEEAAYLDGWNDALEHVRSTV